jgi:hypothetical protein
MDSRAKPGRSALQASAGLIELSQDVEDVFVIRLVAYIVNVLVDNLAVLIYNEERAL